MLSASVRDASWYNNPNTNLPKVTHVANGKGFARCDSKRIMLVNDPFMYADAADVPQESRCRSRACVMYYEIADAVRTAARRKESA